MKLTVLVLAAVCGALPAVCEADGPADSSAGAAVVCGRKTATTAASATTPKIMVRNGLSLDELAMGIAWFRFPRRGHQLFQSSTALKSSFATGAAREPSGRIGIQAV